MLFPSEECQMVEAANGAGAMVMVMSRLHRYRLPRMMAIKEAVDRGEALDEWTTAYLERVLEDAQQVMSFIVDKHPEYHDLYGRVAGYYKQITDKALENAERFYGLA